MNPNRQFTLTFQKSRMPLDRSRSSGRSKAERVKSRRDVISQAQLILLPASP